MKIDCHFHMLGDGTSGSGCYINSKSALNKIQAQILIKSLNLERNALGKNLDQLYLSFALESIRASKLDKAVILAQDYPYSDQGDKLLDKVRFYVPNKYVLSLAKQYSEFIPAVSIHPRKDASLEELEICHREGARIIKYLPSVLNIDFSKKAYKKFFDRVAELKMICLVHTGGELSLPVLRPEFHNPIYLVPLLERGIKVIAAHGGTSAHYLDPDYKHQIKSLFLDYSNLYVDNSGMNTPLRAQHLVKMLDQDFQERMLYGSDLPIPPSSLWLRIRGKLSAKEHQALKSIDNLLDRDLMIKEKLGFKEESLHRLSKLLDE